MFNELAKVFSGQRKERRHSPRQKVRCPFVWLNGTEQISGTVMEMSLNGCLIVLKQQPKNNSIDVIIDIERRKIPMRLNVVRGGTINRDGVPWAVLGCTYSGVAADDYDSLVRFLKGIPESGNKAASDLAMMDRTDDAYRMLPQAVQKRVLSTLASAGRIEIPPEGQQPLLKMEDLGEAPGGYGRRLAVHSRVATKDGPMQYDSVITVEPNGKVTINS
jgi:hypothetical protein